MISIQFGSIARLAVATATLGMAGIAHASLVEIKFATGNTALNPAPYTASEQAFLNALSNNLINPANFGSVTGVLFYESTTTGNGASPAQNFNGAVDSLSFNVANWFSQSLTNIGNNGDISVRNNAGASSNTDGITTTVSCTPGLNNTTTTTCTPQTYNFNYAITDTNTGVTWALDQFVLTLSETSTAEPLSDLDLPTKDEWESPLWTVERVTLRFNPSCVQTTGGPCGNVSEFATISFLAVPEPGSLALLGLGLFGLGALRRKA